MVDILTYLHVEYYYEKQHTMYVIRIGNKSTQFGQVEILPYLYRHSQEIMF